MLEEGKYHHEELTGSIELEEGYESYDSERKIEFLVCLAMKDIGTEGQDNVKGMEKKAEKREKRFRSNVSIREIIRQLSGDARLQYDAQGVVMEIKISDRVFNGVCDDARTLEFLVHPLLDTIDHDEEKHTLSLITIYV